MKTKLFNKHIYTFLKELICFLLHLDLISTYFLQYKWFLLKKQDFDENLFLGWVINTGAAWQVKLQNQRSQRINLGPRWNLWVEFTFW
jgi:hypothetical protein